MTSPADKARARDNLRMFLLRLSLNAREAAALTDGWHDDELAGLLAWIAKDYAYAIKHLNALRKDHQP